MYNQQRRKSDIILKTPIKTNKEAVKLIETPINNQLLGDLFFPQNKNLDLILKPKDPNPKIFVGKEFIVHHQKVIDFSNTKLRKDSDKSNNMTRAIDKPKKKLSFFSNSFAHSEIVKAKNNTDNFQKQKLPTKKGKISKFQMKLKNKLKQSKMQPSYQVKNVLINSPIQVNNSQGSILGLKLKGTGRVFIYPSRVYTACITPKYKWT